MSESIGAALRRAAAALAASGIENASREARLLLGHALGVGPEGLLDRARPVPVSDFEQMVARRCAREPLALIRGRQGFWTLDLEVSADTLIPRPDSETVIEAACAAFPRRAAVRSVLDLGTGTGALLLAALVEFPAAWGVGVDLSPAAAALAARNARGNGLGGRAMMLCGDWVASIAGQFNLILSNPPYIRTDSIAGLMPEVARHEPRRALDGGADGLAAYRALLPLLPSRLSDAGTVILEFGEGQADDVAMLAEAAGLRVVRVHRDLATIERVLVLQSRDG
jgi:release factor glutamine methyltransferase